MCCLGLGDKTISLGEPIKFHADNDMLWTLFLIWTDQIAYQTAVINTGLPLACLGRGGGQHACCCSCCDGWRRNTTDTSDTWTMKMWHLRQGISRSNEQPATPGSVLHQQLQTGARHYAGVLNEDVARRCYVVRREGTLSSRSLCQFKKVDL